MSRAKGTIEGVRGHVVQDQVRRDRSAGREVTVLSELGKRDNRFEIFLVVDVRIPLRKSPLRALFNSTSDERLGAGHVL